MFLFVLYSRSQNMDPMLLSKVTSVVMSLCVNTLGSGRLFYPNNIQEVTPTNDNLEARLRQSLCICFFVVLFVSDAFGTFSKHSCCFFSKTHEKKSAMIYNHWIYVSYILPLITSIFHSLETMEYLGRWLLISEYP